MPSPVAAPLTTKLTNAKEDGCRRWDYNIPQLTLHGQLKKMVCRY